MTKPPVQATVTISPYKLVRILNLASLHGKLERLYLEIDEEKLNTYGFNNGLISYCSFSRNYIDGVNLDRSDPVGVIADVESWHDTASRLNNSYDKPDTVHDHEFHRSITTREDRRERRKEFLEQYTDESEHCMIEFHCDRNSSLATRRTIIAQNQYEDPLPTPRLTLVYWEKVHHIMAEYDVDRIRVNDRIIENKYQKAKNRRNSTSYITNIFSTPKNERDYGNRDLFYSDELSPEEIATALWAEIKTKVRRRSDRWLFRSISTPDSEISFNISKLNRINNFFNSNDRFRSPSNLDRAPSSFKTNVETIEELVEDYDSHWGPPYPVELRDGEFIVDPKYSGYSGSELHSIEADGPGFRKEVASLDSIADSLSDKVMLESGPDIPHLAVIKRSDRSVLRYLMPDLK